MSYLVSLRPVRIAFQVLFGSLIFLHRNEMSQDLCFFIICLTNLKHKRSKDSHKILILRSLVDFRFSDKEFKGS